MKDHKKINPLFNVFLKELKGNFQMMQTVILVNQKLIFKRVLSSDFLVVLYDPLEVLKRQTDHLQWP